MATRRDNEPRPPMPEGDESLARRLYDAYLESAGLYPCWDSIAPMFQSYWLAAAAAAEQWEQERVDAAQAALLDRETQPPMPPVPDASDGPIDSAFTDSDFRRIQRLVRAALDGPKDSDTPSEWGARLQEIACQLPDSLKGTK